MGDNRGSATRVFVGGLAWAVDSARLGQRFTEFGPVEFSKVVYESGGQRRSRGFGFVKFATTEARDRAVKDGDGMEFDGRRVNVKVADDIDGSDHQRPPPPRGGDDRGAAPPPRYPPPPERTIPPGPPERAMDYRGGERRRDDWGAPPPRRASYD